MSNSTVDIRRRGETALAAVETAWSAAGTPWNPDALTALYTPDALFFGGRPDLAVGEQAIHDYFASYQGVILAAALSFRDQHFRDLGNDRILAQGFADFTFVLAGDQHTASVLRTTLLLEADADGWKIAQYHAAPPPAAPPLGEGAGDDSPATGVDAAKELAVDSLQRLLTNRFTCRAYRPEPVPEAMIRSIVSIAGKAASWCNVQPWHLTIVSAATMANFRDALMDYARHHPEVDSDLPFPEVYRGVHAGRRRETGYRLYSALGIQRDDQDRRASQGLENFRLFGAPHTAIVTIPAELGPYGAVDCGGFINAFLLAAQAHGVATSPQAAIARHAKFVRRYFGIGDERHMVCAISFGYADGEHAANQFRTSRAAVDEIMDFV